MGPSKRVRCSRAWMPRHCLNFLKHAISHIIMRDRGRERQGEKTEPGQSLVTCSSHACTGRRRRFLPCHHCHQPVHACLMPVSLPLAHATRHATHILHLHHAKAEVFFSPAAPQCQPVTVTSFTSNAMSSTKGVREAAERAAGAGTAMHGAVRGQSGAKGGDRREEGNAKSNEK